MLKALSLFTGIGGLDFGFEAAGFTTVAAVEADPTVAATIRLNRKWDVLQTSLDPRRAADVCSSAAITDAGPIDIVIAGPPCQPFSKAAYWREDGASGLDDPRSKAQSLFFFPADWGEGHFIGLVRVLDRICERAKLADVTPHTLRHTFASLAGDLGFSELTIAALLGHASRGVTQR